MIDDIRVIIEEINDRYYNKGERPKKYSFEIIDNYIVIYGELFGLILNDHLITIIKNDDDYWLENEENYDGFETFDNAWTNELIILLTLSKELFEKFGTTINYFNTDNFCSWKLREEKIKAYNEFIKEKKS